jgi:predicted RNA-binding protein with PIN domain
MTVFLIDGYNVMHELRRREGRAQGGERFAPGELEQERARLLDRIASFMGGTPDRAIVVFDSHGSSLQKMETATRNMEVYFGSLERSADAIIERVTYALSAAENVVVVTSDYGLQKTTFIPNVTRLSARLFVEDLQGHTRKVANLTDCTTIVHRVEDRLDAGSLERLKELRERLSHEEGGGE